MAQANKLSRKELKQPDSFQTTGNKFLQHFADYRKQYLMGLLGVLVLAGLVFGVRLYFQKRDAEISQSFGDALETYLAPVMNDKEKKADEENADKLTFPNDETKFVAASQKFAALVEKHGSTSYGKFALFYLANCHFRMKQFDKAREEYQKFMAEGGKAMADLFFVAESNFAQTFDAEGKLDQAAAEYQKLLDKPEGLFKDQSLYMLASIAQRQGKRDQAVKLYNDLLTKYPETELKSQAEKMLTVLGAPKPEPKLDAMLQGAKDAKAAKPAEKKAEEK